MAYLERDELDRLYGKLEDACKEKHLSCQLVTRDPIRIVIQPDMTMEGQISMLDSPAGYNGKDSALEIVFVNTEPILKPHGTSVISKKFQDKLLNMAQKIHYMYLWVFFRDEMERRKQAAKPASAGEVEFPATEDDDPFDGADEE